MCFTLTILQSSYMNNKSKAVLRRRTGSLLDCAVGTTWAHSSRIGPQPVSEAECEHSRQARRLE